MPDWAQLMIDLDRIAIRTSKLMVSHRDPEYFFLERSKVVAELRGLVASLKAEDKR